jgi:hypothetical protein
VKHLKPYKLFESRIQDLEDNVRDILLELEDEGFQIEMSRISKDIDIDTERYFNRTSYWQKRTDVFLEVRVLRPWGSEDRVIPNTPTPPSGKYPGNIFIWREIKDVIIRLTEWYYSQSIYEPIDKETIYRTDKDNSPLRFSNSGIEFGIGCSKEEDFTLDDTTRFTSLRMEIKL